MKNKDDRVAMMENEITEDFKQSANLEEKEEEYKKEEEEVNGSDPIFPGGPTHNTVENWKDKYGQIYAVDFDFGTFIYRPMKRLEYKKWANDNDGGNKNNFFQEERICEICVLWPEDYDHNSIADGYAGTPSLLSEYILNSSGFTSQGGARKL